MDKNLCKPVDHVCRFCGSRIMEKINEGISVGNTYKCFTCGRSGANVEDVCWCGFRFKGGKTAYQCLPTNIIEKYPEAKELITNAFLACGIKPNEVEVGVVSKKDYTSILREIELRREKNPIIPTGIENDLEEAVLKEEEKKGTHYSGLYLENLWRKYFDKGEGQLFVRALIEKLIDLL